MRNLNFTFSTQQVHFILLFKYPPRKKTDHILTLQMKVHTSELESDFAADKSLYNMIYNIIRLVGWHGATMKRLLTASLTDLLAISVAIMNLLRCYGL